MSQMSQMSQMFQNRKYLSLCTKNLYSSSPPHFCKIDSEMNVVVQITGLQSPHATTINQKVHNLFVYSCFLINSLYFR